MSRLERLVNLTAALRATGRPMSADELRERVPGYPDEKGSFRRQFERDKEALRELGLPLQTAPIFGEAQVGYRIPKEEYELRDPGLDPDEVAALQLAARLVRLEGVSGTPALWKLGPAGPRAPLESAPTVAATLPGSDALGVVLGCIAQGESVRFRYREEARRVVPRQLSFRNGHWYLAAYDLTRADERSFRMDRVEGDVRPAGRAAAPELPADARPDPRRPWELGDHDAVAAYVRVDPDQAAWAAVHIGEEAVTDRHNDGSITLALQVRNEDAFRSFVLGFLDHAEVESPPELRDELVAWVAALADTHSRLDQP